MASYTIEPVSLTGPTASRPVLAITFRVPSPRERDALHPATGLQVSFTDGVVDMFVERLTARDVEVVDADDGLCRVVIGQQDLPRARTEAGADFDVRLHAWKGEKWLGSWDAGKIARPMMVVS